ncbi:hypothetical protein HYH03_004308 [Edaphochlamys debaryana]|uniref:Uncharacterized protein n=1 Tax=Edaphochlamys debaryana TaxID=47281 RepID=A0A836C380_9CHLO|nr:hypothetical protein HYH03_004308 [Edaphochlamys debaryana]|eukprot:KAG2497562.1 hypothetical protein HYH03_004308 [Edaphochlamys debaryana]
MGGMDWKHEVMPPPEEVAAMLKTTSLILLGLIALVVGVRFLRGSSSKRYASRTRRDALEQAARRVRADVVNSRIYAPAPASVLAGGGGLRRA